MRRAVAIQLMHEPTSENEAQGEVRTSGVRPRTHKERVRASLAWALEEHADTLAKLAK